jgi:uncharacterized protein (DUF1800 family)
VRTEHSRGRNTVRVEPLAVIGAIGAALVFSGTAQAGLGTAVEFYNPALRHYFITAHPEEAAALDAGTSVKGWSRTGGQFTVFTEAASGLSAVCRFFGTPGIGPNSHFYTADAAECAKVKTLPAWTFEEIAFYIPTSTDGDCGGNWPVYRSYYTDNIADANHRFTTDLTAHVRMPQRRGDTLEGIVMCAPVTDEEREADVVRLLEQASAGPTEALVSEVKAKGIENWLDEQLAMNATRFTQYPWFDRPPDGTSCINDDTPPVTPEKYCHYNKVAPWPVAQEFFRQSKTAPDQLRLRMAHVWHQIFVTGANITAGYADFHQRLRDNVFTSFENLLTRYALAPQLGEFQNWVNNVPEHNGIKPNENFARELMQLFTIGVDALGDDGTPKLDASGQRVASYGQADIEAIARVLTGYAFPTKPGATPTFGQDRYYFGDMIPFDNVHDRGAKIALGGRINLLGGADAASEVRNTIRALVNHPNAPPFIAKQLIQKTVTSSPTPGYVSRVAAVFRDNGQGVRGDLAAVTKAVLLDPEARGARKIDKEYGRMREPVLLWTGVNRALDVVTDGFIAWQDARGNGQDLFLPPSVFNYYPADYTLLGGSIPAPEFGIYGSDAFLFRLNAIVNLVYNADMPFAQGRFGPQPYIYNAIGTHTPALTAFIADAANADVLVAHVDRVFLHRTMRPAMRDTLVKAINALPATNAAGRARLALRVVLSSVDYQVQK